MNQLNYLLAAIVPYEIGVEKLKEACEQYLITGTEEDRRKMLAASSFVLVKDMVKDDPEQAIKIAEESKQLHNFANAMGFNGDKKS